VGQLWQISTGILSALHHIKRGMHILSFLADFEIMFIITDKVIDL
jgi:hypothetical protein